jgi:hypothetical protein
VDANATARGNGSEALPYLTITQALTAAVEGDKILIKDGTYEESLNVPERVELYGESKSGVVIDGGEDGITVTLSHKSKLKKLTITGGDTGVLVPERAGATLSNVKIKKADHDGLVLEGDQKTRESEKYKRTIKDCTIKDNDNKGIYAKKSQLSIDDSEISENGEEGVDLRKGIKVEMKNNELSGNGEGNLEFKIDEADLDIKSNSFLKAGSSSIGAQSYQGRGGEILIEGNKISGSKHFGLRCSVQQVKPQGGWANQLFLVNNSFSNNNKGNISPDCGF